MNIKDILYGKSVTLKYSYEDVSDIDWKDVIDNDFVVSNSELYQHNFRLNYEKKFVNEYKLFHVAYRERRNDNRKNQYLVPEYGVSCPDFINYCLKEHRYYSPDFISFYMFLKEFDEINISSRFIISTRLIWPKHKGPASFYMYNMYYEPAIKLTYSDIRLVGEWTDTYVLGIRPK